MDDYIKYVMLKRFNRRVSALIALACEYKSDGSVCRVVLRLARREMELISRDEDAVSEAEAACLVSICVRLIALVKPARRNRRAYSGDIVDSFFELERAAAEDGAYYDAMLKICTKKL